MSYDSHNIIINKVQSDICTRRTGPRVPICLHSYLKLRPSYKLESSYRLATTTLTRFSSRCIGGFHTSKYVFSVRIYIKKIYGRPFLTKTYRKVNIRRSFVVSEHRCHQQACWISLEQSTSLTRPLIFLKFFLLVVVLVDNVNFLGIFLLY